jgi:hypothetical protein
MKSEIDIDVIRQCFTFVGKEGSSQEQGPRTKNRAMGKEAKNVKNVDFGFSLFFVKAAKPVILKN